MNEIERKALIKIIDHIIEVIGNYPQNVTSEQLNQIISDDVIKAYTVGVKGE